MELSSDLVELLAGRCCIADCGCPSELFPYQVNDPSARPLYCAKHKADGSPSHMGSYKPCLSIDRSVSHKWDCCDSTWFLSHCSKRESTYVPYFDRIPVTDFQRSSARAEAARLDREQSERDAFLRQQGGEEAYDR
jgi:hypothetical protein